MLLLVILLVIVPGVYLRRYGIGEFTGSFRLAKTGTITMVMESKRSTFVLWFGLLDLDTITMAGQTSKM